VPGDIEAAAELMANEGLVPDERYIDLRQLVDAIDGKFPDVIDRSKIPQLDPSLPLRSQLIELKLYHNLESDPRLNVIGTRMEETFVVYMRRR
jgi:hypothetical protein